MQATESPKLDELAREAAQHVESQEYDQAERLYREILKQRLEHEGIPATYTDMYNLGEVLDKSQKYDEALPVLRELFVYLSQRAVGQDTSKFVDMEVCQLPLHAIRANRGAGIPRARIAPVCNMLMLTRNRQPRRDYLLKVSRANVRF